MAKALKEHIKEPHTEGRIEDCVVARLKSKTTVTNFLLLLCLLILMECSALYSILKEVINLYQTSWAIWQWSRRPCSQKYWIGKEAEGRIQRKNQACFWKEARWAL